VGLPSVNLGRMYVREVPDLRWTSLQAGRPVVAACEEAAATRAKGKGEVNDTLIASG
jgi:hypothetical protein